MQINIEPLKKKDSNNPIDFDFVMDKFNAQQLFALGAEKINYIRVYGDICQENGIIAIRYNIGAEFTAKCARCDEETEQSLSVGAKRFIVDRADDKEREDDDNFYIIESSVISLEDFAMEFLELEAPSRYLCNEDCAGLCPKCGKNLNGSECNCPKKEKNPSFKILDGFFDK